MATSGGTSKYEINGIIETAESSEKISGLTVEIWDKDRLSTDYLATSTTDESGRFRIAFKESYFKRYGEKNPDLYFKIFKNGILVASTEHDLLYNVKSRKKKIVIKITAASLPSTIESFYDLVALAQTYPVIFHELVFQPEKVVDRLNFLTSGQKTALKNSSLQDRIRTLFFPMVSGVADCTATCEVTCCFGYVPSYEC